MDCGIAVHVVDVVVPVEICNRASRHFSNSEVLYEQAPFFRHELRHWIINAGMPRQEVKNKYLATSTKSGLNNG